MTQWLAGQRKKNMVDMKEIISRMFEEKADFYTYLDMYKESHNETFIRLAEAEGDHYKMLYDLAFKEPSTTAKEEALHNYAQEVYNDMLLYLKEIKSTGAK